MADPGGPGFEYVSPVPGSRLVSRFNNIILRPGPRFGEPSLRNVRLRVEGAASGPHAGSLELSDDRRTLLFQPDLPFSPGEEVTVTVERMRWIHGAEPDAPERGAPGREDRHEFAFNFFVSPLAAPAPASNALAFLDPEPAAPAFARTGPPAPRIADAGEAPLAAPTLPRDYPAPTLRASSGPSPGHLFFAPFTQSAGTSGHLMIVDNLGQPIFYRQTQRSALDFKPQPGGRLSYFTARTPTSTTPRFYVLDAAYQPVDSVEAGNGYVMDPHEFLMLPNGHVLFMIYDPQPVRMDSIVPGGRASATVVGLVVQELDLERRVVFQWRSWDHIAITDAASNLVDLTSANIDYVHGNSIALDREGDLVIGSRHLNEITRVSRRSGEILWRLGRNAVANQFEFPNDPRGFSHQHDARILPNGNLLLFDNGNQLSPEYSRAVEYAIDEERRVATQVWEYRHPSDLFGPFLGSAQRLPNGRTLIGWGGATAEPKITEVNPDGSIAFELGFPVVNQWSYRAVRAPWRTNRILVDRTALALDETASLAGVVVTNPGAEPVTLNYFTTAGSDAFRVRDPGPLTLGPGESATIEISYEPSSPGPHEGKAYIGAATASEVIVQDVELSAPAAGSRRATAALQPGPRSASALGSARTGAPIRFTLARPGRATLDVFDVRGRRIATLLDEVRGAGTHETEWRPGALASGVYFLRLSAPDGVAIGKLVHLR